MPSCQTCFYVEVAILDEAMTAVDNQNHRYRSPLTFPGMTSINRNAGNRSQVFVTSFWDNSLETADESESGLIDGNHRLTGSNAPRKGSDALVSLVWDTNGNFRSGPHSADTGSPSNGATSGPSDGGTLYSAGSVEETPAVGCNSYQRMEMVGLWYPVAVLDAQCRSGRAWASQSPQSSMCEWP
jgi:hypothetical protein